MRQSLARASIALGAIAVVSTFAFSASAACPPLSRSLIRSATGTDVTALQQFLITQGVLSADSATGYFGPLTEKAVQNFQASKSIVTTGTPGTTGFGLVGPKTRPLIATLCSGVTAAVKAHVVPKLRNPNCPAIELPTGTSCKYKWKEVRDTIKGCTASWQCAK